MANGSFDVAVARSWRDADQPSLSARALDTPTRIFLTKAGISPGMHVLDVCSGSGDLTFLLREFVGRTGHVTGVDSTHRTTEYARERAAFRDFDNVAFVEAQIEKLPFSRDFDAIVGRAVLMYRSNPVSDIQNLIRCLRPGGIVAFQEMDLFATETSPPAPVVDEVCGWLAATFERARIDTRMGRKLYGIFEAAGLPAPDMRLDGYIGGHQSVSPGLIASIVRALMPQIEALGIATAADLQVETLEERMRADLLRSRAVMSSPLLIGAWSQLPS